MTRDYIEEYDGNVQAAVLAMAADLMRGDRAGFKQGYTLPNALGAAASFLTPDSVPAVLSEVSSSAALAFMLGAEQGIEGI